MKSLLILLSIFSEANCFSQTFCLMVDQNNEYQEYLGTFDISSGSMNQISDSYISTSVNNGTSPVIDPVNRKYIYSSAESIKIIDLDDGNVVNSFTYNTGFSPRHFAYNQLDSTTYCLMVDQNNGYQEYLGTFDISSGLMNQISGSYISTTVNNGTSPVIDSVNRKYIYSSTESIKIIDLDDGNVVNSFNYSTGFYPRHFAYLNNIWTGINYVLCPTKNQTFDLALRQALHNASRYNLQTKNL